MSASSMEQEMNDPVVLIREGMKTPRAAAVAGILFSVLLATSLILLRVSVPATSQEILAWSATGRSAAVLALTIVPFSGIAFLWFIGVLRDRLGVYEDRLFATVFFGSGILFLAMFFSAAAVAGATMLLLERAPRQLVGSGLYAFGHGIAAQLLNVYAHKMAGVFMMSSATLAIRTRVLPRWIAVMGYTLAALLLLTSHLVDWLALGFPLWVFILSVYILVENLRVPITGSETDASNGAEGGR